MGLRVMYDGPKLHTMVQSRCLAAALARVAQATDTSEQPCTCQALITSHSYLEGTELRYLFRALCLPQTSGQKSIVILPEEHDILPQLLDRARCLHVCIGIKAGGKGMYDLLLAQALCL